MMLKNVISTVVLAFMSYFLMGQSNDHMFPGQPVSKSYIDFDSHGFMINGKRTFLVSAGLEYARIPHELWKDRLLRLKRGGFNCVEIYTFWNWHEPQEGRFEFSGDHDLDAFLKLVNQLGMYCIARVGPYYCAEWDFGGYPHWLRFKKGMTVRAPDTAFMKYMDRFFDQLLPIVARNQINRGGSVILVQLENEHPASWGTYIPNEYFKHLQATALRLGIEVPYFFSGLHHASDPAGNAKDLYNPKRPNPWMSTEFWSVWYDKYGSGQRESDVYGRRTWKIITRGGNGYNYYMAHGGTNFGYTNNNEDAASYDYGTAVGQTGDLRPIYYQFKRNAFFARSLESVLENSSATHEFDRIASEGELGVSGRASDKGDVVSLDNSSNEEARATFVRIDGRNYPTAGKLVLEPSEILPLVHHFSLTDAVSIDWTIARVLGIQKAAHQTTLVVYGKVGSYGNILFDINGQLLLQDNAGAFDTVGGKPDGKVGQRGADRGKKLSLQLDFTGDKPTVYSFSVGDEGIRIVAVDAVQADHTWFIDENGVSAVVVGPEYVGDVRKENGLLHLGCERPWYPAAPSAGATWIFDGQGEKKLSNGGLPDVRPELAGLTGEWETRDASGPASIDFDDASWLSGVEPQQMGADGDTTAYAWYRTSVRLSADGAYSLDISKGHGRYIVFLDGKKVAEGDGRDLSFTGKKGVHTLAIFSTHDGRDKLFGHVATLDVDEKGIEGVVTLHKGVFPLLKRWKFLPSSDSGRIPVSYEGAKDYVAGEDAFEGKKGYGWFHIVLPTKGGQPDSILFSDVDDNAIVYINGQKVGQQRGWGVRFAVGFPKEARRDSSVLDVFVENNEGQGGLGSSIKGVYGSDQRLKGWRQKGGPGSFEESRLSLHMPAKGEEIGRPVFYRNYFNLEGYASAVHPMWRVTFEGLSHGFIWVNGHNLGRYPEVVPVDGLYIPECWLVQGRNEVVVLDEYGKSPAGVKIKAEKAASRSEYEVKE